MKRYYRIYTLFCFIIIASLGLSHAAAPVRKVPPRPGVAVRKTMHKPALKKTNTVSKVGAKPGAKPISHAKSAASPKRAAVVPVNPMAFLPEYKLGREAFLAERYEAAWSHLKKSMPLCEKAFGPTHKNTAIVAGLLGESAFKTERYDEAAPRLRQSLNVYRSIAHPDAAEAETHLSMGMMLGSLEMYNRRFEAAEAVLQEVLPLAEKQASEHPDWVGIIRQTLIDIRNRDTGPDYMATLDKKIAHWNPSQPIRIFITDGRTMPGWRENIPQEVKAAYLEWEQILENRVHFEFTQNPEEADALVQWVERPLGLEDPSESETHEAGHCHTQSTGNGYWFENNITIALNGQPGKPISDNKLHNTLLHEIEHSLGVSGSHSTNPGDILFRNNQYDGNVRRHPTTRDIRTVKMLYDLIPEVTNPPGINLVRYARVQALLKEASRAYNQHDPATAYAYSRQALAIYSPDSEAIFLLALSANQLQRYDEALPAFQHVMNLAGNPRQGEAAKMFATTLLDSGTLYQKSGQKAQAESRYWEAWRFLTQALQAFPLDAEQRRIMQEQLSWLNQRQALAQARSGWRWK
jgi:tetratricopeptide (TPR) repeat protein